MNVDNREVELPAGINDEVLWMRNEDVEEALVAKAQDLENKECKTELIQDWRKELMEGSDLLVTSKWNPG